MSSEAAACFVENLTWDVIAGRLASGSPAILPVGAASKEHGFHLPMNTDRIQAEWLASELAQQTNALIWPAVTYGYYPAFTAYAGSISLSVGVFESLILEVTTGIMSFGCRSLFVLDTGISTGRPIERALAQLAHRNVVHLKIHDGEFYRRAVALHVAQRHGSHADEAETSIMLALVPQRVDMARAQASPTVEAESPGPLTPSDQASPNYSPSGSFGDPTRASAATGKILLAAMVQDLTAAMNGQP